LHFGCDFTSLEPVFDLVHSLDTNLLHKINVDWNCPALDVFFVSMSNFGLLKWPSGAAILALLIWGGFRERTLIALFLLCLLIGDAIIGSTLKEIVNRPRPFQGTSWVRHVRLDGYSVKVESSQISTPEKGRSFPSGHTYNNAALATLVMLLYPPWGVLAWIWALLMAYSRVYTGDHYPSDVLFSLVLGACYALLICCVASRIWQWLGPRVMPQISQKHPRLFPKAS